MRLPDDTSQIRLAPVRALRAVFSGVGQLLLAADRLREEDARKAQESGENQRDAHAYLDGRLSSSVRLITPPGLPAAQSPHGAKRAADGKSGAAGRGRKRAAGKKAGPGGTKTGGTKTAGTKTAGTKTGRRSGRSKAAPEPPRFRSLDLTGNVRMLTDQDITGLTADQLERSTPGPATTSTGTASTATTSTGTASTGTTAPSWSEVAPPWSSWSREPSEAEEAPDGS